MELETSPFYNEIKLIQDNGPNPVNYHWSMRFIVGGKVIPAMKVLGHVIKRAYNVNYADDIVVRVAIGAGVFHHDIYPFRNDLQAILFREPIDEVNNALQLTTDIEAQIMRATLLETNSSVMAGNSRITDDAYQMDLGNIIEIDVALTDLALEKIRMITVDGIYRDVPTWLLMRHILTVESAKISADSDISIIGVDVYPASNEVPVRNIVIPPMRLSELPDHLNYNVSGVYSSGFGFYLQKKHWYIFPSLDLTRYEKSEKGLTIIRLPPDLFHGSERTYRRTANQVIALVGDEAGSVDLSESLQLNQGNGLRYADADVMFDSFSQTKNNITTVKRKQNNTEYLIEERPNGLNNIQFSPKRITSNAMVESSIMARRLGMYLSCTWDYSDPGSIWPGMPVKYMFMVNGQVYESFGIVQSAEHHTKLYHPGITTRRHVTSTSLLLFLGKATEWKG